ncbi:trypsin-like peptidase domain-containing protein [Actinacidiphila alni]|uniref:trypsin-like peptidase domain-containing protein n=1 Tax=Actinacidiphila alni TaxID=380248 RepID=UPI003451C0DD
MSDAPVAWWAGPLGGEAHARAVWLAAGDTFLGSGFLVRDGLVVTAAHVVAGADGLMVRHPSGARPVPAEGVRAVPPRGDGGRFHPYPDLALLTVPGWTGHPVAPLAAADPAPGTEVTALGYSTFTPDPGVQPDSLALRTAGRAGDFVRVLGDGVREGFSGSMLLDRAGQVVGVVKGSRSYADDRGGWCTPVSALRALLGLPAAPDAPYPPGPPPTDAELVDALMAFPSLGRADHRYDLLDRMGDHLRLRHSFEVEERSARRDHLFRLVAACRNFRDERAALRALCTAMEEIVPDGKALDGLRAVVGRAIGGWAAANGDRAVGERAGLDRAGEGPALEGRSGDGWRGGA